MKNLKYYLLSMLLLFCLGAINAQQGNQKGQCKQAANQMSSSVYGQLGLSDDQMTLVNAENDRFAKERQELRSQSQGSRSNQMEALRQTHSTNMQSILNQEQYSELKAKQNGLRKTCNSNCRAGKRGKSRGPN